MNEKETLDTFLLRSLTLTVQGSMTSCSDRNNDKYHYL